jgi:hypothetical protein
MLYSGYTTNQYRSEPSYPPPPTPQIYPNNSRYPLPIFERINISRQVDYFYSSLTGDPLDLKMFEGTGWELEEPGDDNTK